MKKLRLFLATLVAVSVAAGLIGPPAAAAASSTPAWLTTPNNNDTSQFHLLFRARQVKAPNCTKNSVDGIMACIGAATGGIQSIVERYSGQCRDAWDTYSQVIVKTNPLSMNADLMLHARGRAENQYIRYLFQLYLKRQPTCDELHGDIWRMGKNPSLKAEYDFWNYGGAWTEMGFRICDSIDVSTGQPWAVKFAPEPQKTTLKRFCSVRTTNRTALGWAFQAADEAAELCNPSALSYRQYKRMALFVTNLGAMHIKEVKASIGAIGNNYQYKDGRIVKPETVVAVYDKYFANLGGLTPQQKYSSIRNTRQLRDFTCPRAGIWVQEEPYTGFGVVNEIDYVLRDFFDLNAGRPYGTDVIGIPGNLWGALVALTNPPACSDLMFTSSPPTPAPWSEQWDDGTLCLQGQTGHTSLKNLIKSLDA